MAVENKDGVSQDDSVVYCSFALTRGQLVVCECDSKETSGVINRAIAEIDHGDLLEGWSILRDDPNLKEKNYSIRRDIDGQSSCPLKKPRDISGTYR